MEQFTGIFPGALDGGLGETGPYFVLAYKLHEYPCVEFRMVGSVDGGVRVGSCDGAILHQS